MQNTPWKKASAWEWQKEQKWSVADMEEVFDYWEANNQNPPPPERLSTVASREHVYPIPLYLRGWLGIDKVVDKGKSLEEKGSPTFWMKVNK